MPSIFIIGVGGVGQRLLDDLPQMLCYERLSSTRPDKMVLVDGDSFENRNLKRQRAIPAWVGKNKADCFAQLISSRYPIKALSYPAYLSPDNVDDIFKSHWCRKSNMILMAVDSMQARKLVNDHLIRKTTGKMCLISGGNELTDGNVQVFRRDTGSGTGPDNATAPLDRYHDEIKYPEDQWRHEMSCDDLAVSEPQIIAMNRMVATAMLAAAWSNWKMMNLLSSHSRRQGELDYGEVYLDLRKNKSVAVVRR